MKHEMKKPADITELWKTCHFFLKRRSFTCKNQNLAKYVHVQLSVFVFLSKEFSMIFVLCALFCDEIMTDITCQHLE